MSENTPHPLLKLESIADKEKYLLTGRDQIVLSLTDLSKKTDLITAYYDKGSQYIITTVVDVLQERDLVILEYSRDNQKNRDLLAAGTTVCLGKHNDIDIRFELNGLRNARYQGERVFAAPLPNNLLRLQRREFFRAHTPLMDPITCQFQHKGAILDLPLADISIGGLALVDKEKHFEVENGLQLSDCKLQFPDKGGEMEVTLEVRASFMFGRNEGQKVRRIGCAFVDLSPDKSGFIQRYINRLQIQQKNMVQS